jgi:predicted peroxiredoxin
MKQCLLIDSRDPFEDADGAWYRRLAEGLKARGWKVSLFLVENALFGARKTAGLDYLQTLGRQGVEVRADEFGLRERGVLPGELAAGVMPSPIDHVIEQMMLGASVIWR